MNILQEAYTALLAGITQYKPGTKEILWEDEYGDPITIEIIDAEKEKYILRGYYKNGRKLHETECQGCYLHGKHTVWYDNGSISLECELQNGERHGKCIAWYENGNKRFEEEYYEGQRQGKNIAWWEDGSKRWEEEFLRDKKA